MLQASGLQIQKLRIRPAAHRHQDFFRLKAKSLACTAFTDHRGARGRGLYRLDGRLQVKVDPQLLHAFHTDLGEIGIQHGENMVLSFHHRDFGAKCGVGTGQLQANHAAADHHHALRQLFQAQSTSGIHTAGVVPDSRNGRNGIDGSHRYNHGVAGYGAFFTVGLDDLQHFRRGKVSLSFNDLNLVLPEKTSDA